MPTQLSSLPAEILVNILSAATSTSDVVSLICASSTFYKAFVPAKRIVFSNILAKELGSAVRDALAILLFFPEKISNVEAALQAVQQYADLPIPDLRSEQGGVSCDQILQIAFWNRIVRDLVDNYAASRLPELRKVHPDAAGPLTAMERRRIARAILRHQILARIHDFGHRTADMVYRREHVANRLFSLWPPWEMQQLADVSVHLVTMATFAVQYLLRGTGPPARERSMGSAVCMRREEARGGAQPRRSHLVLRRDFTPLNAPWMREREELVHDLGILHKRWIAAVAEAATVPYGSPAVKPSEDIEMHVGQYFLALTWNGRLRRGASDTVTEDRRPMCYEVLQEIYEMENAAARLVFAQESDHHDGSAPFAWVDGHGGIDCQRWSDYVHRQVLPEEVSVMEPAYIRETTGQWRWMGFVFWDRPRVAMLKSRLFFPTTGWFISPPPSRRKCRALVRRFEPRRRG